MPQTAQAHYRLHERRQVREERQVGLFVTNRRRAELQDDRKRLLRVSCKRCAPLLPRIGHLRSGTRLFTPVFRRAVFLESRRRASSAGAMGPSKPGPRAIVAMSGGVDSSATAYLLQKQGYAVEGVYMHNWDTRDETGQCTSERDWADVQRTCSHLRIRCRRVDLVRDYWTEVFDPMLADYGRGWTPNPDVMCNRHIKFGRLLDLLEDDLAGGDCWLATGHYARIRPPSSSLKTPELLRGVDPDKDQSYFLSSLGSGQLRTVLFPLGSLLKSQVKTIAIEEAGMAWLRNRKESMGICMVGKRKRFSEFLDAYVGQQTNGAGHFAVLADSEDVRGAPVHLLKDTEPSRYLTIGQSARIPGRRSKHYVAQKIVPLDTVVVVPDHDHPALFRSSLTIHDWRWVRREVGPAMLRISAQTCYRDTMRLATLRVRQSGRMPDRLEATIEFDEPVRGAALGQWVAAYHGDLVLGGGTVSGLGPWEWTMASELDVEQAARTMLQT